MEQPTGTVLTHRFRPNSIMLSIRQKCLAAEAHHSGRADHSRPSSLWPVAVSHFRLEETFAPLLIVCICWCLMRIWQVGMRQNNDNQKHKRQEMRKCLIIVSANVCLGTKWNVHICIHILQRQRLSKKCLEMYALSMCPSLVCSYLRSQLVVWVITNGYRLCFGR